ncbi:uncharacterized protein LOC103837514 isoform X3 [Brassica rapa]|uniref:uncharacterized protein LOC103837514 isoform X3 n=1 Tax=Brassica campestris TaxID=3711 RepID=UPI00142DECAF|nr:uncharacterized protein LOC103837514 isoform X3 [Brassica rapa]XP_033134794.1 uncharacterized protein LOC103837514 isoform X3 [Brassica rapa]
MEGSCQRNHLSFPRIMSEHTLTQLTGLLESKVLRSQRDLLKLFVPSYSQPSSRRDTGSLHVLHLMAVKMEELLRPREFPATRSRETKERKWKLLCNNNNFVIIIPFCLSINILYLIASKFQKLIIIVIRETYLLGSKQQ